jgi:hypothetical protein
MFCTRECTIDKNDKLKGNNTGVLFVIGNLIHERTI